MNMKNEIDAATQWWMSQVIARTDQLLAFRQALWSALHEKYKDHWYESDPCRGQGFRCVSYVPDEGKIDAVLLDSSRSVGLDLARSLQGLEGGVTMWVDPGDVEVKFLSSRRHKVLYKNSSLSPAKTSNRPRTRSFQKYSPGPSGMKPSYQRPAGNSTSPPVRKLSFTAEERSSRAASPPFIPAAINNSAFRASSPPFVPTTHTGVNVDNDMRLSYGRIPHQPYSMGYGSQFAPAFGSWQPNAPQCGVKESDYFYNQEQHMAVA